MNRNRSKNNSYLRKSFHFKKFFFVFASQAPFFKLKISNVRTHFSVKWFPRWDSQRFSSDGSCYREKWYPKSSPFFVQFDGGPISFSISAWKTKFNIFRYAIGNWLSVVAGFYSCRRPRRLGHFFRPWRSTLRFSSIRFVWDPHRMSAFYRWIWEVQTLID